MQLVGVDGDRVPVAGGAAAAFDRRVQRNRVRARVALVRVEKRRRIFRLRPGTVMNGMPIGPPSHMPAPKSAWNPVLAPIVVTIDAGIREHRQRVDRRVPDVVGRQHRAAADHLLRVGGAGNGHGEGGCENDSGGGGTSHRSLLMACDGERGSAPLSQHPCRRPIRAMRRFSSRAVWPADDFSPSCYGITLSLVRDPAAPGGGPHPHGPACPDGSARAPPATCAPTARPSDGEHHSDHRRGARSRRRGSGRAPAVRAPARR